MTLSAASPTESAPPDLTGHAPVRSWTPLHLGALLAANVALALGAWLVRLADTGPVAAAFWRLTLALPVLLIATLRLPASARRASRSTLLLVAAAGVFFAADLAAWHIGIKHTKVGNASLFGNSGSLLVMVWGMIAARRAPRGLELAAILAALTGAGLLMGSSLEVSSEYLLGDVICVLAGVFYAGYIILLGAVRSRMAPVPLLLVSTTASAPVALAIALAMGEAIVPHDWTPLIALAVSSQLVGQGLLIYSLRHFSSLVIGMALLAQPAIAALVGWLAFGETLGVADVAGMVLLAAALAMAKAGDGK